MYSFRMSFHSRLDGDEIQLYSIPTRETPLSTKVSNNQNIQNQPIEVRHSLVTVKQHLIEALRKIDMVSNLNMPYIHPIHRRLAQSPSYMQTIKTWLIVITAILTFINTASMIALAVRLNAALP